MTDAPAGLNSTPAGERTARPRLRPRPRAVLVADDDPVNRRLASLLLERAGHTVHAVASGFEALAALTSRAFDLVLLDFEMPGLSGPETARRIRSGDCGADAKCATILAVTGHCGHEERHCCLEAGMDGLIVKPLTRENLSPWIGDSPEPV